MSIVEGIGWGCVGGALAELLGLWKLRHTAPGQLPVYLRSLFFWATTIGMIISGGVLVAMYLKSDISLSPVIAVNVGATAPLIIGGLTAASPKVS